MNECRVPGAGDHAIHNITKRWMAKKIGPRTSGYYSIHYLIGFITHCVLVEGGAA